MKTPRHLAALLSVAFVLSALAVQVGLFQRLDHITIVWIQSLFPRSLDLPFSLLSLIGSFELTTLFLLLVLYFWYRPPERAMVFVFYLLLVVVEVAGKYLLSQPGPPRGFSRYVLSLSMPTGEVYTPFSFPSGHASRSAFVTAILFLWVWSNRDNRARTAMLLAILLVFEFIMLVSRVDLGDHWLSDVIGGTLLGVGFALAPFRNLDRTNSRL